MQRKAASGTLVPEIHRKLEEDQGTEAEMLSTEGSGTHDSIIEATWLQHHDSNNDEAHDMARLHEDVEMPHWQPPESPKPRSTNKCSTEEIAIHRYRARTRRCSSGPFCRNYDCYLSHHCPAGDRCRKGSDCSFFAADDGDLHYSNPEQLGPAFKLTTWQTVCLDEAVICFNKLMLPHTLSES